MTKFEGKGNADAPKVVFLGVVRNVAPRVRSYKRARNAFLSGLPGIGATPGAITKRVPVA